MKYKTRVKIVEGFYKDQEGFVVACEEKLLPGGVKNFHYIVEIDDEFKMRERYNPKYLQEVVEKKGMFR